MRRLSRLRAASLLVGLTALGGCHSGPDYQRPVSGIPAAWQQAPPGTMATWPSADWWRAFGSPQLDALMHRARAGNLDLIAAAARVRQADAQARIAGAPLLPSIGVQGQGGPLRLLNNTGHERQYINGQGIFQASYELDFWGKNQASLESAEATADSSHYQREVVWLTTAQAVANTYFTRLSLQERLRIAADNLDRAQRDLDATVKAERQGTVPQADVVTQQSVVANLVTVVPPLRQQLTLTRNALALLVGELPEALQLTEESLEHLSQPQITSGAPAELLARRPDVQAAEAQLIAANANIRVARAQFFPSIDISANGGLAGYVLAHSTAGPLGVYSLMGSITQPLFEGGALQGQLGSAKAQYQATLAGTYQKAVLSAFSDVEDALASVKETADEQTAQQATLTLAQKSNGLANGAFRGGTSTILAVLLSETSLYTTEDALAQARLAHFQAIVGLFGALGGGWQPDYAGPPA
jgi:multidrug efflux system outer membrane protein